LQGKGIGGRLLEIAADTVCHKYPEVAALTVSSSPNSISFYAHAGFAEDGEEIDEEGMRFMPMKRPIR
jgi:predicted GNAT family N-acyltransferase